MSQEAGGDASHARRRPRGKNASSLYREIEALRTALGRACALLEGGEANPATAGAVVARLSDSIVRALLAQKRLAAGDSVAAEKLRAEIDRVLRASGMGESDD